MAILAGVVLVATPVERWRPLFRGRRRAALVGSRPSAAFLAQHAAAGAAAAIAVIAYETFLAATFRQATVNVLQFSPHPWETERMAMALGLVCLHAALAWSIVLAVRLSVARWRVRRGDERVMLPLLAAWSVSIAAVWAVAWNGQLAGLPRVEALVIMVAVTAAAFLRPRGLSRAPPRVAGLPAGRRASSRCCCRPSRCTRRSCSCRRARSAAWSKRVSAPRS